MSIMQAMLAGSSALSTYGEAMTVIGNNLANANTTAFKGSRSTFEDVLIQTVGISGTQGAFNSTASVIDLSIDGRGFFEVKDPDATTADSATTVLPATSTNEDTFYTRAGDFKKDMTGKLVSNSGMVLQGWKLDLDGTKVTSQTDNVDLSLFETSPPKASGLVDVGVNLNADDVVITDPLHTPYDPNDPASYNSSTTVRVYDSLGKGHNIDLHFRKMASQAATVDTAVGNTIDFTLTDANTDVTFKFTDSAGNVITADPFTFSTSGAQTAFDLGQLQSGGAAIALTAGTSYDISYTTSAGSLLDLVGADGVAEVTGNAWEWHAVASTDELVASDRGTGQYTAVDVNNTRAVDTTGLVAGYTPGVLRFDEKGLLLSEGSTPITFNFHDAVTSSASQSQEILFDFGDAIGTNGDSTNDYDKGVTDLLYSSVSSVVTAEPATNTGIAGSVQYSNDFSTLQLSQDGYPTGFLDNLSVGQDGTIFGTYTNGQTRPLYQVAIVDFDNIMALKQVGSNVFAETHLSGAPRVGEPQSGRLGSVVNFSLENSNVDMSSEFVRMIATQRAFQASSRIVTVTDGMMEELISLKR